MKRYLDLAGGESFRSEVHFSSRCRFHQLVIKFLNSPVTRTISLATGNCQCCWGVGLLPAFSMDVCQQAPGRVSIELWVWNSGRHAGAHADANPNQLAHHFQSGGHRPRAIRYFRLAAEHGFMTRTLSPMGLHGSSWNMSTEFP
jgi:hypothetical protein